MKTLIAVPCMDQVPAQFASSLAMLNRVGECAVAFQVGSLIYSARNDLAKAAIKHEADFVMWFDSDMVFAPDTMQRMMKDYQDRKGDIICGLYFRRTAPYTPVLYEYFDITAEGAFVVEPKKIPDDIFEVGGCGFGAVLMPTDVLMDVMAKYGPPFNPIQGNGEDLSFCWRARECGYKIVCDPSIPLGHVGHQVINRQFYEAYQSQGG